MKLQLSHPELNKILNKINLNLYEFSPEDFKKNIDILKGVCKFCICDRYHGCYDIETDMIVYGSNGNYGVNRDIFYDLYLMYKCFSIPGWHYDLFFSSLARPLLAYQILFEETEEGIQPVEVRINEEVRGRLVARTEAEIHNLIYDVDTIQAEVFLLNEPYDSHITVLSPWMESKDNPFIFWDLVFKNKQNTNMNIDFLTQLTNWTEKEFINYAKEKGIKIGVKTLYNYRDYALFPIPYKVKVKGKNINYYDREWIKYLEWINEKKKEKPEKSIESFRDLPEAEEFFKDIPDIRKEIKKKKKKRLKSGKSK